MTVLIQEAAEILYVFLKSVWFHSQILELRNAASEALHESPDTVSARYIAVVYIAESDISRSHVRPHFLATHFANFADMTPKSAIFREIGVIPWTRFAGDRFSRNLLTADAFWYGSQETIIREICSGPIWLTCEMRAGTHAVQWPASEGGSLTPPLYHRVGSY